VTGFQATSTAPDGTAVTVRPVGAKSGVVTVAAVLGAEDPVALVAETRYLYVVSAVTVVSG